MSRPVLAGPPYITDDPEPTDYQHFEIYAFTAGTATRTGHQGETGIDFNYGGAPNLQLSTTITIANEDPHFGRGEFGIGNIEVGAKYEFLHQDDFGLDVSVYPQFFLPSVSSDIGERHTSLFLPVWVQKDWNKWSTFGGGGCTLDNGNGSKDWCQMGWAVTRQVLPDLNLGVEIYHQTADERGGKASTGVGAGAVYDLSINYHLLVSYGPGIQNASQTDRYTWYAALETTF
jgi:hypothetical protein